MANKKTHDVVATVGEYESQGEKKKRYVNCGSAFTNDQGQISIKLDTVPVSPQWSGWLSLYVPKDRDSRPAQKPTQQRAESSDGGGDDVPF
jgi:hypothetical protein